MSRARLLVYAAALLAMVGWSWIVPEPALAQLLPPLPTGSLIVTVTTPATGATVSGTVPVTASVSIVGSLTVAGVQFQLDGGNLGSEDGSAPYSVSWSTTNASIAVRDDARRADVLFQQAIATYQAYNNYPDDGATGKSIYAFNSHGANTITGTPRAVKVSWNRPYTGRGAGQFFNWEYYFVRWLEQSGYDVKYSTDLDTHQNSARLLESKAFLSVGHDEYWSKQMYDGVERARDAGVHLGFFGANQVYWQVRLEASPVSGAADRVMVGYKDPSLDPVQGPTTTILWRHPFLNRPEQQLIGVQFSGEQPFEAPNAAYVVTNSSSWVYEGTGLADGDRIPGIVGYEVDSSMSSAPLPASVPGTYQLLSQSPFLDPSAGPLTANSSIYQAPSGAWVFGAGTISWAWGLELEGTADPRLQRTTANLLNRFVGASPQP